jgi:hypothetical protein
MIQVQVFGREWQRQRQRQLRPDYNNTSTFKKKKVELKIANEIPS